jgi:hypothetical protein
MELETHLIVASNLNSLSSEQFGAVMVSVKDIGKMLNRLIGALRIRKRNSGLGIQD